VTVKKRKMENFRIAVLDLYNGVANEGMRCIRMLIEEFYEAEGLEVSYQVFDVRQKSHLPEVEHFDAFISSGGPGDPILQHTDWEIPYFQFIENLLVHNKTQPNKKHLFAICHSFQLLYQYFSLGVVNKRRSTSFGVMPIHRYKSSKKEPVLAGLEDPFWAVDSRDYQAIKPNHARFEQVGAKLLCIEKDRPHIALERAVMAVRFTSEVFGTQFHPEADAEGMHRLFKTEEKKAAVIKNFGEDKYHEMIAHLEDPDKIMFTEAIVIPNFLKNALLAYSKLVVI
jgi:homoserine O-succinyltransferase/O-acetyltransferase